jgi:predicted  nucleic acid-binding Zn-ribbon protein
MKGGSKMSQHEHYETVMREQEFLENRLQDYRFQKERLEWQLMEVTNSIEKIQSLIVKLEKELGDVSDS